MERDEIRLECIKLALRSSPNNIVEALARAEKCFDFVMQFDPPDEPVKGEPKPLKSTENAGRP